jgi:carboxylesterase type B
MCNYFSNFARTGNPNGNDADGTPMPEWRPYIETGRALEFGDEVKQEEYMDPVIRYVLDANLKYYGLK